MKALELERALQIPGERFLHLDEPPRRRVLEPDAPGVQERPIETDLTAGRPSPVAPIADDGMSHRGEMDPDLMRASRPRRRLEQGGALQPLPHREAGLRLT